MYRLACTTAKLLYVDKDEGALWQITCLEDEGNVQGCRGQTGGVELYDLTDESEFLIWLEGLQSCMVLVLRDGVSTDILYVW